MFRANVAALIRYENKYVACGRSDFKTWQCVQGGIEEVDLSPLDAIKRELMEELGLEENSYRILFQSRFWRRYYFTQEILAKNRFQHNLGQEQLWFFVELLDWKGIQLEKSHGEFDRVELFGLEQLIDGYSVWKKPPFVDFCRELDLLK